MDPHRTSHWGQWISPSYVPSVYSPPPYEFSAFGYSSTLPTRSVIPIGVSNSSRTLATVREVPPSPPSPRRRYDISSDHNRASASYTSGLSSYRTGGRYDVKSSDVYDISASSTSCSRSSKLTRRIDKFLRSSEQTLERKGSRLPGMTAPASPDQSLSLSGRAYRSTSAASIAVKACRHREALESTTRKGADTSDSLDDLLSDSDEGLNDVSDDTSADLSKLDDLSSDSDDEFFDVIPLSHRAAPARTPKIIPASSSSCQPPPHSRSVPALHQLTETSMGNMLGSGAATTTACSKTTAPATAAPAPAAFAAASSNGVLAEKIISNAKTEVSAPHAPAAAGPALPEPAVTPSPSHKKYPAPQPPNSLSRHASNASIARMSIVSDSGVRGYGPLTREASSASIARCSLELYGGGTLLDSPNPGRLCQRTPSIKKYQAPQPPGVSRQGSMSSINIVMAAASTTAPAAGLNDVAANEDTSEVPCTISPSLTSINSSTATSPVEGATTLVVSATAIHSSGVTNGGTATDCVEAKSTEITSTKPKTNGYVEDILSTFKKGATESLQSLKNGSTNATDNINRKYNTCNGSDLTSREEQSESSGPNCSRNSGVPSDRNDCAEDRARRSESRDVNSKNAGISKLVGIANKFEADVTPKSDPPKSSTEMKGRQVAVKPNKNKLGSLASKFESSDFAGKKESNPTACLGKLQSPYSNPFDFEPEPSLPPVKLRKSIGGINVSKFGGTGTFPTHNQLRKNPKIGSNKIRSGKTELFEDQRRDNELPLQNEAASCVKSFDKSNEKTVHKKNNVDNAFANEIPVSLLEDYDNSASTRTALGDTTIVPVNAATAVSGDMTIVTPLKETTTSLTVEALSPDTTSKCPQPYLPLDDAPELTVAAELKAAAAFTSEPIFAGAPNTLVLASTEQTDVAATTLIPAVFPVTAVATATVAAALPEPTVAGALPKPTVAAALPEPTVAAALPEPTVAALPEPTVAAALPEPTVAAALPEPTVAAALLEPTVAAALPKPTVAAALPEPTVAAALPEPTFAVTLPEPTVAAALPEPTVVAILPVPTVAATLPQSTIADASLPKTAVAASTNVAAVLPEPTATDVAVVVPDRNVATTSFVSPTKPSIADPPAVPPAVTNDSLSSTTVPKADEASQSSHLERSVKKVGQISPVEMKESSSVTISMGAIDVLSPDEAQSCTELLEQHVQSLDQPMSCTGNVGASDGGTNSEILNNYALVDSIGQLIQSSVSSNYNLESINVKSLKSTSNLTIYSKADHPADRAAVYSTISVPVSEVDSTLSSICAAHTEPGDIPTDSDASIAARLILTPSSAASGMLSPTVETNHVAQVEMQHREVTTAPSLASLSLSVAENSSNKNSLDSHNLLSGKDIKSNFSLRSPYSLKSDSSVLREDTALHNDTLPSKSSYLFARASSMSPSVSPTSYVSGTSDPWKNDPFIRARSLTPLGDITERSVRPKSRFLSSRGYGCRTTSAVDLDKPESALEKYRRRKQMRDNAAKLKLAALTNVSNDVTHFSTSLMNDEISAEVMSDSATDSPSTEGAKFKIDLSSIKDFLRKTEDEINKLPRYIREPWTMAEMFSSSRPFDTSIAPTNESAAHVLGDDTAEGRSRSSPPGPHHSRHSPRSSDGDDEVYVDATDAIDTSQMDTLMPLPETLTLDRRCRSCTPSRVLANTELVLSQTDRILRKSRSGNSLKESYARSLSAANFGRLAEVVADLAEEHSTAQLAGERLEAEQADRMRLEKELDSAQSDMRELSLATERLETEKSALRTEMLQHTSSLYNGDIGDTEDASTASLYRRKFEWSQREVESLKQQLRQQQQDDLEQGALLKKQLEKKVADAREETEEQRQVAAQLKKRTQRLQAEMNDLKILLEEQAARNSLLEKKQRKFDSDLAAGQDELRVERLNKEKVMRERDAHLAEKYAVDQELSTLKLELELRDERVAALTKQLDELSLAGQGDQELTKLRKTKHDLESKIKDQEEELDELAGQVQMLEAARTRLEMSTEQLRKESKRELQQREEEVEEVRLAAQKRVKALEAQVEAEHEERTQLVRDKHELERRLVGLMDRSSAAPDDDAVHRLKKDLRKTKALLKDTQTMLEKSQSEGPSKLIIRQLKTQLEDCEFAKTAALKARLSADADLSELQSALDDAQRARKEVEDRSSRLLKEKTELQTQLEEGEELHAETLKKYKCTVSQVSVDQITLAEQSQRIAELEQEKQILSDRLLELSSKVEVLEGETANIHTQRMLQMKVKELESKLELELSTRKRIESQVVRLKEQMERLSGDCDLAKLKETQSIDQTRKLDRQLRQTKEEAAMLQQRNTELTSKRQELEKQMELMDSEIATLKSDLKLAFKRIEDLQMALQGDISDSDSDLSDSGSDSDASLTGFLPSVRASRSAAASSNASPQPNRTAASPFARGEDLMSPGSDAMAIIEEAKEENQHSESFA